MNEKKPDHWHRHTFGSSCGKIAYIVIKMEEGQDRSLGDAVSQTSKPASLAIIGGEGEAPIYDNLQNCPTMCLSGRSLSSLQVGPRC